jgi:hypothetical protein
MVIESTQDAAFIDYTWYMPQTLKCILMPTIRCYCWTGARVYNLFYILLSDKKMSSGYSGVVRRKQPWIQIVALFLLLVTELIIEGVVQLTMPTMDKVKLLGEAILFVIRDICCRIKQIKKGRLTFFLLSLSVYNKICCH